MSTSADRRGLGQSWAGSTAPQRTVTDNGADGAGGGDLDVKATVDVGDLEVGR